MKRFLTAILTIALVFTGLPYMPSNESHAAGRHWAQSYLSNLVRYDVMRGDPSGDLRPDDNIKRAEFVAMVNRAFGYDKKGKINFSDVPKGAWYSDDINIAKTQGYMQGMTPAQAAPEDSLTREQAVTLICRALKIEGVDSDTFKFGDSRNFSQWSKEYINATTLKQIVNGYPDSTFKPQNKMTRGEMAKVLSSLAGEIIKEKGSNYIGYADRNVSMVRSQANLRDTIVPGDLYLTAGLGTGASELTNVVVNGDMIISGTGNSETGKVSAILRDSDIHHLIIDSQSSDIMSVRAEGGSVIEKTTVKRNAYLEEDNDRNIAFKDVVLNGVPGTKLNMAGSFDNVRVMAPNNQLSLSKGYISVLTVDEEAKKGSVFLEKETKVDALMLDTATTVTGTGEVEQIVINADGCNVSMLPKKIYIRPGIKATINGRVMTSLDGDANNAPPEFMHGYPKVTDVQATSAKLIVKVNKPGKVYWGVVNITNGNEKIYDEQILKPAPNFMKPSGKLTVVGDKEFPANLGGLKSGEKYKVVTIFEDLLGNKTVIEEVSFATIDVNKPTFLGGTPILVDADRDVLNYNVTSSKDGILSWAVLPYRSVPPTAETLAANPAKVPGAIGAGTRNVTANDMYYVDVRGTNLKKDRNGQFIKLDESTMYDVYFVIRDNSDNRNLSQLRKIPGSTKDKTPPKFVTKPWQESSTVTSVNMSTMASEPATLYWAAYNIGDNALPWNAYLAAKNKTGALTTEESNVIQEVERAISTGQKAYKNGNRILRGATDKGEEKFIISGLQREKPYDVYFILKDKAGNFSVAEYKQIQTKDTTPPTAVMQYSKQREANFPLVDSDIIIAFNEIVCYDSATGADKKLSELEGEEKKNVLFEMFTLHDLNMETRPNTFEIGDFDYSKVKIEDKEGKTYVRFSPEAFIKGGKKALTSGGHYKFDLDRVIDTSNNVMTSTERLKLADFFVVPPAVALSNYYGTTPLKLNEIGFNYKILKPTSVNNDDPFDVIISTDRTITFNIYAKKADEEEFKPIKAAADQKNVEIILAAGQGMSIGRYLGNSNGGDFALFSQVALKEPEKDYKIVIRKLNSDEWDPSKASTWSGDVNISFTVVSGKKASLDSLGAVLWNGVTNPMETVKARPDVLKLGDPIVKTVTKTYADDNPPELVGGIRYSSLNKESSTEALAKLKTDNNVRFTLMTNKDAKFYYAIAKKADADKLNPQSEDVMESKPRFSEGEYKNGISLVGNRLSDGIVVNNLEPEQEYVLYYVLEGKNGKYSKEPTKSNFKTSPVVTPMLSDFKLLRQVDNNTLMLQARTDIPAMAYYVAFAKGAFEANQKPTEEAIIKLGKNESVATMPQPITAGSFKVEKDGISTDTVKTDSIKETEDIEFNFLAGGPGTMNEMGAYDIFIVLERVIDKVPDLIGRTSKIAQLRDLRTKDTVAPAPVHDKVIDGGLYITAAATKNVDTDTYDATVDISFGGKGIYYYKTADGKQAVALTEDALFDTSSPADGDKYRINTDKLSISTTGDVFGRAYSVNSDNAVGSMKFHFKAIRDGESINLIPRICNQFATQNETKAYKFVFRMIKENDGKERPYFEIIAH